MFFRVFPSTNFSLIKSSIFLFGQMNKVEALRILGANDSSTHEDIKKAYLRLSKRYHPDINHEPSAVDQFKQINEAYVSLKNMIRSFEEGGTSFTVERSKYNKYDGKISKEDFGIFEKYMQDKRIKKEFSNKSSIDEVEKEWQQSQDKLFYEIFGRKYNENPDILWQEKNQNLREIYEEEIEKLFQKIYAGQLDSIEKTIKDKINEAGAKNGPKSRDRLRNKEQINKFLRK